MDLGLEVSLEGLGTPVRTRGRKPLPIEAAVIAEITETQIVEYEAGGTTERAGGLQKLSQRHHTFCRNMAAGMSVQDSSIMAGYTADTGTILAQDSAVKELVRFYATGASDAHFQAQEQLSLLRAQATELMSERLEDNPDSISDTHLITIIEKISDRTGHGPQSTTHNLHVHTGLADRLNKARRRVAEIENNTEEVIEVAAE